MGVVALERVRLERQINQVRSSTTRGDLGLKVWGLEFQSWMFRVSGGRLRVPMGFIHNVNRFSIDALRLLLDSRSLSGLGRPFSSSLRLKASGSFKGSFRDSFLVSFEVWRGFCCNQNWTPNPSR